MKYRSLKMVLEKVARDVEDEDFDWADALEWAGEAINELNLRVELIQKTTDSNADLNHPCPIDIEDYRGELPCDLAEVIAVREYTYGTGMRETTDLFHISKEKHGDYISEYTYQINDNYIFTNFEEGQVELIYLAYPTDENGWIMIPDKCVDAVHWYIIEKIDYRKLRKGKLSQAAYQVTRQNLMWAKGKAQEALNSISIDGAETLKNIWIRLVPTMSDHVFNHRYSGKMETKYTHPSRWQ